MYNKAWCTSKVVVLSGYCFFLISCGRRILNFLLFTIHCDQSEAELTDMWNQTSHIRHLNSDVWQQTSDIRRLISDTWRQTSEIRCLISDVWYQTPYIRRLTSDIWNQTSKNKSLKTDVSQQTFEIRQLKSDDWHETSDHHTGKRLKSKLNCEISVRTDSDNTLCNVESAPLLGLEIDSKLSINAHVDKIIMQNACLTNCGAAKNKSLSTA